ncbi:MAG: hypothetical protein JXB88_14800 [Spirochaetales bacterium]|nr:hypothetical protein [Spirochaetales bacterium]
MDDILYLIAALIVIAWSLWLFIIWQKKAGLVESSPFRFILLFLPATGFFLISISGWSSISFLRMDIMGFVFYFFLIVLTWLFQFLTIPIESHLYKKIFLISIIISQAGSLIIVCFVYFLKLYPMAGISISAFFKLFEHTKGLKILWYLLNPETNKQDTFDLVNKLLITFCTYLPLTIVRMWYTSRKFKQLKHEIDELKQKIEKIL